MFLASNLNNVLQEANERQRCESIRTSRTYSDSKGFPLRNQYWTNYGERFLLTTWCTAGAKTSDLIKRIVLNFEKELSKSPIRIYMWSGTCDLTTKDQGKIRLTEWGDGHVDDLISQFEHISDSII